MIPAHVDRNQAYFYAGHMRHSMEAADCRDGFVVWEALVTCALVLLAWYMIMQCAVQGIRVEQDTQKRAQALVLASSTIERLRAGKLALKNQSFTQDMVQVVVVCQKSWSGRVWSVTVKVMAESEEVVCLKTVVLSN